jgi:internalin A
MSTRVRSIVSGTRSLFPLVLVWMQEAAKKRLEQAAKTGKLDMSSLGLPIFPKDVLTIPNLRFLALSDNNIKSIPREVGLMTALTQLRLVGNQITSLPAEIGTLTNLQT